MPKGINSIIPDLKAEIKKHDQPANRVNYQQFFKEKLKEPVGLRASVLRNISNRFFKDIKKRRKSDILKICDELLDSKIRYGRFFAFDWADKIRKDYTKQDFRRFESWLRKYVDNWGSCDHLCGGPLGNLILKFPDLAKKTKSWTRSKNMWLRRAAAVSLIIPVRNRKLLDEAFQAADLLLKDKEDLVQKGYGWMLKEAANRFPKQVFEYVLNHKDVMPRTALRYAIEKYPADQRKMAMAK